jgi:cytochrome c peroxidase
MKTNPLILKRTSMILAAGIAALTQTTLAQLPSGTSSAILPPTGTEAAKVEITNPGNHTWVLQKSPDLTTWTTVETFKVHNGRFRKNVAAVAGSTGSYYRLSFDSAGQTLSSTLAGGLLLPATAANYANQTLPPAFLVNPILAQDNTPANNPVTNNAATLGRALFYDKRLSQNQTISCSSCHQAAFGFSDPKPFSVGFAGGLTGRNSMGLSNARWYQRRAFFWDERAATLEAQVLLPIQNSVEMGMTLPDLVTRLSAEPYYSSLFTAAFGDATVTSDRISRALAQFVRSIISTQSKYDIGRASTPQFSNFTAEENEGRNIFNAGNLGNCAACHGSDNFVPGPTINNNGLENPYVDKGRGAITGLTQDEGLFKVPSLRNIELTAPYMHDGRFATLEEVVEFYNSGVVNHPNLSPPLRGPGGTPRRLNLTAAQKQALVAFMKTLTDTSVTTDPKFQDPFNYGD